MACVRVTYGGLTRLREDYDACVDGLRRRAARVGLSEAGPEAAPPEVSVCRYDRPEREPWYTIEGLVPGAVYHAVLPAAKLSGMVMVENVNATAAGARLTDMMQHETKTVHRARQHVTITYDVVFSNNDWRVAVGMMKANSYQKAVVVDVAYLPFSAAVPPTHAGALIDEFAALLGIPVEKLAAGNADVYARCGLPADPLACAHATPYVNLALDVALLAVRASSS